MAETAIKVGQTMNLVRGAGSSIPLHNISSSDGSIVHYLYEDEQRVKVIGISFNRRELRGNSLWIQVQSVKDPTKIGWCRFDCGGWEGGKRLRIERVVFHNSDE